MIQWGPLAVPMQVALALSGVLAANAAAAWLHRRAGIDPGPVLWTMILAGFAVARLVFVLRHHDLYAGAPWSALDLRDGGLDRSAGLLAACVIGAELTRRRQPLRRPLLKAVLAGCAVWLGGTLLNQALAPADAPLPAVEVRRLDGSPVVLRGQAGRPLVVNLWATWCPPCRREMPALASARQAYPGVDFMFVSQGEAAATVERFLADQGLPTTGVFIDPTSRLGARTGSSGYPTTLFYDAAGRLRLRHAGELSEATLRDKLDLLRERR